MTDAKVTISRETLEKTLSTAYWIGFAAATVYWLLFWWSLQ